MQLRDYLIANGGPAELAKKLEVTTEAVRLWAAGDRIPGRDHMRRIVKVTRGQVQPNDFYEAA